MVFLLKAPVWLFIAFRRVLGARPEPASICSASPPRAPGAHVFDSPLGLYPRLPPLPALGVLLPQGPSSRTWVPGCCPGLPYEQTLSCGPLALQWSCLESALTFVKCRDYKSYFWKEFSTIKFFFCNLCNSFSYKCINSSSYLFNAP